MVKRFPCLVLVFISLIILATALLLTLVACLLIRLYAIKLRMVFLYRFLLKNISLVNMPRRYLFRFKIYDELGLCVARGLVSSVLHSDLSLFEYINDGRVTNTAKMSISEFMAYVFVKNKSAVFEPSFPSEFPSL